MRAAETERIFADRLLERCAAGDFQEVSRLLRGGVNPDLQNEQGWTGLMFAAKNGRVQTVETLLGQGCRKDVKNSADQSAADIAVLWNHPRISAILNGPKRERSQRNRCSRASFQSHCCGQNGVVKLMKRYRSKFSSSVLKRYTDKRKDVLWLDGLMRNETTRFMLFLDLQVYVNTRVEESGKPAGHLATATYKDVDFFLETGPLFVFLGVETGEFDKSCGVEERAWFALDISGLDRAKLHSIMPCGQFVSVFPGCLRLSKTEAAIFSEACSLMVWHAAHKFCPTCGRETSVEDAGCKRSCDNGNCSSQLGVYNTNYPRVDPSVVMLVLNFTDQQCLLGRKRNFPPNMWCCVAGYVEPGESLEDTCRRELKEQLKLEAGAVEYHSSQPWPFPSVLLLGCVVHALSNKVKIDEEELKDARWFTKPEVLSMLNKLHPDHFCLPPEQTLSYSLIESWVLCD